MTFNPTAYSPRTLAEAYAALAERGGAVKIIAGGTDLMVLMNARMLEATDFLDIWRIDELRGITDEGGAVRVGSLTTYTQLIRSPLIREHAPALAAASRTVGAIQIQNRGTIGGNVVNASPAGDSLPVLAAYDAEVEVGSARGMRHVDYNEFNTGYRRTTLSPDEIVLAVRIPKLSGDEQDFFWKVGTRRAQAISKTVMAARAKMMGGAIESIAIGVGSVAPTVIRARQTEKLLAGATLTDDVIEQARQTIAREVSPITDLRSNEHYRRTVTGNVLTKFLRRLTR
ncbi:MAG TPA: xanthine dehydrogenase family protein subunit M [Blastocatellia bacterium]|jgi:CO/xanthine dehydrogenase FAD-binding subunit|nr:xanthine dehydrogenase family protein subunit M [Blastocatellia bacterium]